jgi:hypothetical protein
MIPPCLPGAWFIAFHRHEQTTTTNDIVKEILLTT